MFESERFQQMTVVAGALNKETEAWLRDHGAHVYGLGDVHVVELRRELRVTAGPFQGTCCIDVQGSIDGHFLHYTMDVDARASTLEVLDRL